MLNPRDVIANDVHHDIDMHAPWMTSVAHGDILEIGVRTGISTAAFLVGIEEKGGHLWSVDINPDCGKVFAGHPQWTFIARNSKHAAALKQEIPAALDILFIDGDHTYEGAKADLENYGPLVKSGGRIILHDVCSGYDPGVRVAFDEYAAKTGYVSNIYPSWVGLGEILVK